MRRIFFFITLFLIVAKTVFAGRPLTTEDATVNGKNVFTYETGITYLRTPHTSSEFTFLADPHYGITARNELALEVPVSAVRMHNDNRRSGMNDINLVLKTLFVPETSKIPATLLRTTVSLPAGSEEAGLGTGSCNTTLTGVMTKHINRWTFHGNLGYSFVGNGYNILVYGVAMEYDCKKWGHLAAEIYSTGNSQYRRGAFNQAQFQPLVGWVFPITPKWNWDTAFEWLISNDVKCGYGVITGLTLAF